jgi:hypothetical protein
VSRPRNLSPWASWMLRLDATARRYPNLDLRPWRDAIP